jgi:large subunit ribosomal protein L47
VKPDHGLWHFFRRKEVDGEIKYETVETFEEAIRVTGRSWTAAELRRKSFSDLHTLWYVVLREKNLIATQKEEGRRMALPRQRAYFVNSKVYRCRKTMARIKYVLNERRLAYEGALRLLAEQQAAESTLNPPTDEQQRSITAPGHKARDGAQKEGRTKSKKSRAVASKERATSRAESREEKLDVEGKRAPLQTGDVKGEASTTAAAEFAAVSLFAPGTRSKDIRP